MGRNISTNTKLTLGIAARLAEEKGVEYLLEAIPLIEDNIKKEVDLLIAGPIEPVGEEKYKNKIMNLVKHMGNKVKFLGILGQKELRNFYGSIDILVLPSVNSTEAFGMVQVEAMLQGTPVVASNLPGVRIPILKTKMGELAEPKNAKSLSEAISKVYRNKYVNTASKIFDINKSYEKYRVVILS